MGLWCHSERMMERDGMLVFGKLHFSVYCMPDDVQTLKLREIGTVGYKAVWCKSGNVLVSITKTLAIKKGVWDSPVFI